MPSRLLIILFACALFSCKRGKDAVPVSVEDENVSFADTVQGYVETETLYLGYSTTDTTQHYSMRVKIYGEDSAMKIIIADPTGNILRSGTASIEMDLGDSSEYLLIGYPDSCTILQFGKADGILRSSFTPACQGNQIIVFRQYP